MRSPFNMVSSWGTSMAIAAAFLFFCSTGLFFGGALRRHPAITALVGSASIGLAILIYWRSSMTVGPAQGAQEFLVPYLYFVFSAAVLGGTPRPRAVAVAAILLAIAFALLAYPQMYAAVDWLHHESKGAINGLVQNIFREAESGLRWVSSAGSSNYEGPISKEAVLHSVVVSAMVIFFLASGLASRLFALSAQPSRTRGA